MMSSALRQPEPKPCTSCGALILWAMTLAGKRMPVDAISDDAGNLRLVQEAGQLVARITPPTQTTSLFDAEPRYRSHFATCPNADAHRRRA